MNTDEFIRESGYDPATLGLEDVAAIDQMRRLLEARKAGKRGLYIIAISMFPPGTRVRFARTRGLRTKLLIARAGKDGTVKDWPRYDAAVLVQFDPPHDHHWPEDYHFWIRPDRLDTIDA